MLDAWTFQTPRLGSHGRLATVGAGVHAGGRGDDVTRRTPDQRGQPDLDDLLASGLRIEVEDRPACRVLRLSGVLDLAVLGAQEMELIGLVAEGPPTIVLDLAGVSFCDSTGLGSLIRAAKRAWARGGALRLVSPQAAVHRLLEVTRVTAAIPLYDTVDDACRGDAAPGA